MDDSSSQRSGATGEQSETSSQRSDAKALTRLNKRSNNENEEGDLLEQKRSLQDGVFSCMYTLVRQSAFKGIRITLVKILLEGLGAFLVAFNPGIPAWRIDTSNPVWQVVRWVLWRSPIMRLYGYDTYIKVLYVMAAMVFLSVGGLVWLTMAMRKQEQSKALKRAAVGLHMAYELIFILFYVSFFDYFVFAANCNWTSSGKEHAYFVGAKCLAMPHVIHMSVGVFAAAVQFAVTALMVVASSDLNPISKSHLASPDAITRLWILVFKAAFVIVSDDLYTWPKLQCVLLALTCGVICWQNFRKAPFYRRTVNAVWCALWIGVFYTTLLLAVLVLTGKRTEERRRQFTMYVLYGIFAVVAGAVAICVVHMWWLMRPARKFANLASDVAVAAAAMMATGGAATAGGVGLTRAQQQKIHKFKHQHEVEMLSRVMRVFDVDGVVDQEAAALGETIIRAGMVAFPGQAYLHILYANYLLEVRKDGPAARTSLQLAARHSPTLVERYQIYCTNEASKRLKDSQDGGMDLQAYIEFRRNFRAVLRVHKEVLALEMELWRMCLRSRLSVAEIDEALEGLEAATARAYQVYKRVLERYPTNGKLLRCYGRFLEDVKHDPIAAGRAYTEAARNGGSDAIMSLDLSAVQDPSKPDFLTSVSLADDAVCVINAEGIIMMVSQAMQGVFGYAKQELEGANVSLLMPQPFSQRHNGYLQRYVSTGEARILDSVREVVALHKDRYVFPVGLCVTKMSGQGTDSVFLGVVRPLPPNLNRIRCWVSPTGVLLCGDQQFASLCGVNERELVGRTLASLCHEADEELEALYSAFREASLESLAAGSLRCGLRLRHRFLADPVPVEAAIGLAGTDTQRILALTLSRTDGRDGDLLVLDTHSRIKFASLGLGAMLNIPARKLCTMRLEQLLPAPQGPLHAKWLRDTPHTVAPTGCRAGRVVQLLNDTGAPVSVKIKVGSAAPSADVSGTLHVVEVTKAAPEELLEEKRLSLTMDACGRVLSVGRPEADLFGFPAGLMVGESLCDWVDIFTEWRERNGEAELQLLMLALLDKEREQPGTSWRVKLQQPAESFEAAAEAQRLRRSETGAFGLKRNSRRPMPVSACLQVELLEHHETGAAGAGGEGDDADAVSSIEAGVRIQMLLWRRDLLTGTLELDEQLVVRRASPMMGLIVGMPATAMVKKPLRNFLDLPAGKSWQQLCDAHSRASHKRSALKGGAAGVGRVSPAMAFVGSHPDSGTMRLILQGVEQLAPGTGRPRITAVVHPDTTFTGAHAELMKVLKLDGVGMAAGDEAAGGGEGGLSRAPTYRRPVSPSHHAHTQAQAHGHAQAQAHKVEAKEGDEGDAGAKAEATATAAAGGAGEGAGKDGAEAEAGALAVIKEEDGGEEADANSRSRSGSRSGSEGDDEAADTSGSSDGGGPEAEGEDQAAIDQAKLHETSASKSEFVAQWVRTLSKTPADPVAPAASMPPSRAGSNSAAAGAAAGTAAAGSSKRGLLAGRSKISFALHSIAEDRAVDGDDAEPMTRATSGVQEASPPGARGPGDGNGGGGGGAGGEEGDPDKWEKASEGGDSSASGSQAASGITSVTDASTADVTIDARRMRLLKGLKKVLLSVDVTAPLDRLRKHSYVVLLLMLLVHVVCYVVLTRVVQAEHNGVYMVHRQALAMDRSVLCVVRILIGTFCARPNITDRSSACTPPLTVHINSMLTTVNQMEEYHQGVYLGFKSNAVQKPHSDVYDIWTHSRFNYSIFMDTNPPQVMTETAGIWVMGNRFIASTREALYWLPRLTYNFKHTRTYQLMLDMGVGPLFDAYAESLDHLMVSAWASLDDLRLTLIVILVVEVLFVQLLCLGYQWILLRAADRVRLLGVLCLYGLPGPVLRQLASKETRILEDSDDESDAGSVDQDHDQPAQGPGQGTARGQGDAAQSADAPQRLEGGGAEADGAKGNGSDGEGSGGGGGGGEGAEGGGGALVAARVGSGREGAVAKLGKEDTGGSSAFSESQTDDATSDGGGHGGGHGGRKSISAKWAGRRLRSRRGVQYVNGKALTDSPLRGLRFMVLPMMWFVALLVIYVISLFQLQGMQGPLASLNMASHVIYRYTRVRAIGFAFLSQDGAEEREMWRPLLRRELDLFVSEYDTLMYGGTSISQLDSVFQEPVPPSTFASSDFSNAFFRTKRCFRYNQTLCFKETSPWFEVTHNGLDPMVRRMISEIGLLLEDAPEDVRYNATRWTYMYNVGTFDLYEGMQQAAQLFVDYSISRYTSVVKLHTILLICTIAVLGLYVVLVLWPLLAKLRADAERQVALLSHVPVEVDTLGHCRTIVRQQLQTHGRRGGKGKRRGSAAS